MKINFEWGNFLGGGLLLYAGGLFFIIRGIIVIGIGFGQGDWVQTTAVVTESKTTTSYSQERTRTNYHFEYEYQVDDESIRSRRYSAAQLSPSEIEGVEQFSTEEEISIFYNPENVGQAVVVQKRPSIFVYFGILLGLIFVMMAMGLTFFGDVSALPGMYVDKKLAQQDEEFQQFGQSFINRQSEPFDELVPRIITQMPPILAKTLNNSIKKDNRQSAIYYLREKTDLSPSLCKSIIKAMAKRLENA